MERGVGVSKDSHVERVFAPSDALLNIGVSVSETRRLASLAAEKTVEVRPNFMGSTLCQGRSQS